MKKVVVVEDDFDIRKIYELKLSSSGYKVITADNGTKAIRTIKKEKPDLVLLDILIPKKDGFEVIKELKKAKDAKIKLVPVFILSNLSSEEDIYEAKNLGVKEYIIKAKSSPDDVVVKINKFFNI